MEHRGEREALQRRGEVDKRAELPAAFPGASGKEEGDLRLDRGAELVGSTNAG